MKAEHEKMLAGELYDALDPELVEARERARDLCHDLNATREREQADRRRILTELLGSGGDSAWLQPPFFCDYGSNIYLGERVYFNFNCVVLDVCEVRIGDFAFFGPAVQIYTAMHPMDAHLRRTQEFGEPVTIGSDVWVGGGAIICPGVWIGSKSVDERLRWLDGHDERYPVFVAELDGRVVGWAALTKWSDRPAYDETVESSFYVAEAFRGRGIGRALKQRLVEAARCLRFHTILARVAEGSDASIHLNKSVGFQHVGTMKEVGFKFGRWLDVHVLQLMLRKDDNF